MKTEKKLRKLSLSRESVRTLSTEPDLRIGWSLWTCGPNTILCKDDDDRRREEFLK